MLEFARALPAMRAVWHEHLQRSDLSSERVLACAARLLDRGFFRIGTEGYAEQNQTYGLATIQKRHVHLEENFLTFDYVAKSGKRRIQSIVDPEVYEVVTQLKRRRGGPSDLLAFKDGRRWIDVRSSDINDYIRDIAQDDFTAKDFRTWGATVLAAVGVSVSGEAAKSKTARKRAITRAVQEVAHYLGNTPAVCRASYIDPRVFDRYRSGWTIHPTLEHIGSVSVFGEPSTQGYIEEAVIDLIEERRDSEAIDRIA